MKTSQQLLHAVLALAKASDLDILEDSKVFSTLEEKAVAKGLGELIVRFDYVASTQFEAICLGKSEAFKTGLRRKMQSPEMRTAKRLEFYEALREIRNSDLIFTLLPKDANTTVVALRRSLDLVDDGASQVAQ